jgi:hypothetical protein
MDMAATKDSGKEDEKATAENGCKEGERGTKRQRHAGCCPGGAGHQKVNLRLRRASVLLFLTCIFPLLQSLSFSKEPLAILYSTKNAAIAEPSFPAEEDTKGLPIPEMTSGFFVVWVSS